MEENEIQWVSESGNIGRGREETYFEYQLEADLTLDSPDYGDDVSFTIVGGVFPESLTLSNNGLISGTLTELDLYVPEFQKPPGYVIAIDGSNYGSYGSAQSEVYTAEFTVRCAYDDVFEDRTFNVVIVNCYTSDGISFLYDYADQYGEEIDGVKCIYRIDDRVVGAEEYILWLRSQSLIQPCNH
jgi:hypothetical protein